ncbi:MAG: right-handed parallel beta-helix repeat-containing protein [Melioribacteraceae bacterium]|nr:right-handed parallel beta-helix repeat-containing protein [Melioribacteraceae bacterium]
MSKFWFIILVIIFNTCHTANAQSIFVSNIGCDDNDGSLNFPLLSIQKGIDLLEAGDTLYLREGAFYIDKPILIRKNGNHEKWFSIKAYKGEQVEINGETFKKSKNIPAGYHGQDGIIDIDSSSYIELIGIGVCHSRARGIKITYSNNINILNCSSRATYNSGIGVRFTSNLKIFNCEVVDANNQDYRPYGFKRRREAPQEAISLMPAWNFEVAYNHVHNNRKEGIDCKEDSYHGRIHHNYVHDNDRQGIYVDSWFGRLHHIEVFENHLHDNDYGIAISAEDDRSSMDSVYIHHNLIYNNRGSGILFGTFGDNHLRTDLFVFNNTIVNNGSAGHWCGLTGGIEVQSKNIKQVKIYNNLIYDNYGFSIGTTFIKSEVINGLKEREIEITNNLCSPEKNIYQTRNYFDLVIPYNGNSSIEENPEFKLKTFNDFRPQNKIVNKCGINNSSIGIGDKINTLPRLILRD